MPGDLRETVESQQLDHVSSGGLLLGVLPMA